MNTEEKWNLFRDKYHDIVDKNTPTVKRKKKYPVPLDEEIRDKIREKDRLSRRLNELKKQKKLGEHETLWNEYCKVRNKVRSLTRAARKEFEKDIARESKDNPKKIYSYINSKVKSRQGIGDICIDPKNPKSAVTDDDQVKADIFSKFFASVQVDEKGESPKVKKKPILEQMSKLKITRKQVLKILKNLKPNKAAGIDKMLPRILREIAEEIADIITSIFNDSINNSEIPGDWLRAIITIIFKKGKKSLAGNYRPVSLTCILCKCIETAIRDHIVEHMKKNKLFSKYQYGFLGGRSVTLQLLYAMEKWTEVLDKGGEVDCIYTDFMKAFDRVPHKRLLEKMASYGIVTRFVNGSKCF